MKNPTDISARLCNVVLDVNVPPMLPIGLNKLPEGALLLPSCRNNNFLHDSIFCASGVNIFVLEVGACSSTLSSVGV